MQSFIQGEVMSPALKSALAPFFFIPVAERAVEGLHRDIKLTGKFARLGASRVALAVRMAEMRDRLQRDRAFFKALSTHMDICRKPRKLVAAMGLLQHPWFQSQWRSGVVVESYEWLQMIAAAVHRTESHALLEPHSEQRDAHERHKKGVKRANTHLHRHTYPAVPRTYPEILKRLIVESLRRAPGASEAASDQFFTLPCMNGASYTLIPLLSDAGRQSKMLRASEPFIEDQSVDQEKFPDTKTGLLAFRVLHGHPEQLKSVPLPAAAAPLFGGQSLVVTVHPVLEVLGGVPYIQLNSVVRPMLLNDLLTLPLDVLKNELKIWTIGKALQYSLSLDVADELEASALRLDGHCKYQCESPLALAMQTCPLKKPAALKH